MRQRKVKDLENKYKIYDDMIVYDPKAHKNLWSKDMRRISAQKISLEVGCGKGIFTASLAEDRPNELLIAIEGNRSVLLRAMEKVKEKNLNNVIFIPEYITDLREWFPRASVNAIYLNFSDPLPKPRTAKHRLTHRDKLRQYFTLLNEEGELFFKTDNDDLFDFSIREMLSENLSIEDFTRDLHRSELGENNIKTEYEMKFSGLGENINYMRVKRGKHFSIMGDSDEDMNQVTNQKSMVAYNGRVIPKEDKIFGVGERARIATSKYGKENVINATVGTMLDDDGNPMILSSVDEVMRSLCPADYATYAPISGTEGFKKSIVRAAFGKYKPKRKIGVVAGAGGTSTIRNAVANYTAIGDKILTHDWHWGPYKNILSEQGRSMEVFELFDANGDFNIADFSRGVKKLLRNQDRLLIMINTPANNPTGYSLSDKDFDSLVNVLNELSSEDKKISLLIDVAYIDFAGDEDEARSFLPILEKLNEEIMILFAYSASKTFTLYGLRCAALICLAGNDELAKEFELAVTYSSRATWSNSPKAPQKIIEKIYKDDELLSRVSEERKKFREILMDRGRTFEEASEECGLEMLPFRAGFFATIPSDKPDELARGLEKENVFVVPLDNGGIRISIASISKEKCKRLPIIIKNKMEVMEMK